LREESGGNAQEREDKAMGLLTSPEAQLDESRALVLCQIHKFKPGVLYLYEKMKLYNEIVQLRMDSNEHEAVIQACKKYGDKDPTLWIKALTYFANKTPLESCRREVKEVLQYIQQQSLLPPLQVIQILSQSGTATLGLIKEYISSNLIREQKSIEEDNRAIRQYREDTEKAAEEIKALRTGAVIFQQMKCGICQRDLDPPAVHFLCMHSFHLGCLGGNENECPTCVVEIRYVLPKSYIWLIEFI
jgi:vacuolar protein sorting-associated protein 11